MCNLKSSLPQLLKITWHRFDIDIFIACWPVSKCNFNMIFDILRHSSIPIFLINSRDNDIQYSLHSVMNLTDIFTSL